MRSATENVCVDCGPSYVPPRARRRRAGRDGQLRARRGAVYSRRRAPRLLRGSVARRPVRAALGEARADPPGRQALHVLRGSPRALREDALRRAASFLRIGDRADWSYLLPERLGRGRYVLEVKATDGAFNRGAVGARALPGEVMRLVAGSSRPARPRRSGGGASVDLMVVGEDARAARGGAGQAEGALACASAAAAARSARRRRWRCWRALAWRCGCATTAPAGARRPTPGRCTCARSGRDRAARPRGWVYKVGRRAGDDRRRRSRRARSAPASGCAAARLLWFWCGRPRRRLPADARGAARAHDRRTGRAAARDGARLRRQRPWRARWRARWCGSAAAPALTGADGVAVVAAPARRRAARDRGARRHGPLLPRAVVGRMTRALLLARAGRSSSPAAAPGPATRPRAPGTRADRLARLRRRGDAASPSRRRSRRARP